MAASEDPPAHSFYFYIPNIRDIGVRIPFSSFDMDILNMLNVSLSRITLNGWILVRAFKIMCRRIGLYLTTRMFFSSFYGTKEFVRRGWVTLDAFLGKSLFKPHSNHLKGWKDEFVRVRGKMDLH